eukprot:CAMPEP_0184682152 /NCGR_PEP_ID=MMETSP0312-20130426/5978_1 /TAXON_ID=31354 /ORGANISM="Compsopogon coeruleus, Strain SAG 36.94" /LENGTH=76 /DNA_ID=CAMNT_0027133571 /DNA_START=44 /DNA_END=274 /DNA_ORIENTATION=-
MAEVTANDHDGSVGASVEQRREEAKRSIQRAKEEDGPIALDLQQMGLTDHDLEGLREDILAGQYTRVISLNLFLNR